MSRLEQIVRHFEMLPHPEGGYYKETYRSGGSIAALCLPATFGNARSYSTAIYFLLPYGTFSAFHRIKSDEVWHFYKGCPLHIHVIHPDGKYELLKLGNDYINGQSFQTIVPAGCWFASEPQGIPGEFSFVGCTVSPGFDFEDFELADSKALAMQFPDHTALINRLCR